MQRRYITVDVFTDRAFGGNPLGVPGDPAAAGIVQRSERAEPAVERLGER